MGSETILASTLLEKARQEPAQSHIVLDKRGILRWVHIFDIALPSA